MTRYLQEDGEEFFKLGAGWRQMCCSCGLVHDHITKKIDGEVWIKVVPNWKSTAAARRKLKKKVVIIE